MLKTTLFYICVMNNALNINQLSSFLSKVRRLRGFGDMDAYRLVDEYRSLSGSVPETRINKMINDLSSPLTYQMAKERFIDSVESLIGEELQD